MPSNCYMPSRILSPGDSPCNALADVSACCQPNDVCLDNGYCLSVGGTVPNVISRGSCTDPTFSSKPCPQMCDEVNPNGGAPLIIIATGGEATYCCGGYNSVSNTCNATTNGSNAPFLLPNGRMITNRTDGSTLPLGQVLAAPAAAATVSAPATASPLASSTSGFSNRVVLVVGIVIPFTVLLLAALGGIWYLWRALQRSRQQLVREMGLMQANGTQSTLGLGVPLLRTKTSYGDQKEMDVMSQVVGSRRYEADSGVRVHELGSGDWQRQT